MPSQNVVFAFAGLLPLECECCLCEPSTVFVRPFVCVFRMTGKSGTSSFITPFFPPQDMMMVVMMTIYTALMYPCCNSMFFALDRSQSSSWLVLSLMVHSEYVCVAIIYWTLTWITGSLSCTQMLVNACDCTQGCMDTKKRVCTKSWLWEENPLLLWGIEPASVVWWSDALTNWAAFHPHIFCSSLFSFWYNYTCIMYNI